jgi:hypothetical protein
MGSKSNYLELLVLDAVLGQVALPAISDVWFALYSVTPSDTGGGTELTGNGYTRVQMANNATNFPNASAGAKTVGTAVTFPTATGSNWSAAVGWAVLDASTAGNFLLWGAMTSLVCSVGQAIVIPAGSTIWTED